MSIPSIEKFSYNICFPALLFSGTVKLSFDSAEVGELALATLLPTGLVTLAALVMLSLALCLPAVNVISVIALSWWSGQPVHPGRIGRSLASNPIILSTLAGVAWSLAGLPLPGLRPLALSLTSALKLLLLPLLASLTLPLSGQFLAWMA